MLTLLHTSDWHLGRKLYGKNRDDEFAQFLAWQLDCIYQQNVDILLIAGDIFDTSSPSNQAQKQYYQFLSDVARSPCRHVVIVAGNHDSPSFLEAPKSLLKHFDIHIIGNVSDNLADEVLVLYDKHQQPEAIITAVPYLKDRDVRKVGHSESLTDKENQIIQGIFKHYQQVSEIAFAKKQQLEQQFNKKIPIIATGHLFMLGGQTLDGDGVKDLYVGSLGLVGSDIFAQAGRYDYVGLGHLHVPQRVGHDEFVRYSGSPIAMGFGEATQQKQVNLVRFFADDKTLQQPILPFSSQQIAKTDKIDLFANPINSPFNIAIFETTVVQSLAIPVFFNLVYIKGDLEKIKKKLKILVKKSEKIWVEVCYQGEYFVHDLREQLDKMVANSQVEILRIKNLQAKNVTLQAENFTQSLDELDEKQVFERCMQAHQVADDSKDILRQRYFDVLQSLQENL